MLHNNVLITDAARLWSLRENPRRTSSTFPEQSMSASANVRNGSSGEAAHPVLAAVAPDFFALNLLADVAAAQPRSILKRPASQSLASLAAEVAVQPAAKRVRFREEDQTVTCSGHQQIQLVKARYSDWRMAQQQLSRHLKILEVFLPYLTERDLAYSLRAALQLYNQYMVPNSQLLRRNVHVLVNKDPEGNVPPSEKAVRHSWLFQKVLHGLLNSSIQEAMNHPAAPAYLSFKEDLDCTGSVLREALQHLEAMLVFTPRVEMPQATVGP